MRSDTEQSDVAVCVLAGGAATRFPQKLQRPFGNATLLEHTIRNVVRIGPVYVSIRDNGQAESLRLANRVTFVPDQDLGRGPLGGLVSAFRAISLSRVFVVAGDAPFVGMQAFSELAAAWSGDVQACVAINGADEIEPLCALYERDVFLRKATAELHEGSGAVRRVVESLNVARVRLTDERALINVNTEAEYRAAREVFR